MIITRACVIVAAMSWATAAIAQGWQSRRVPAGAPPPVTAMPMKVQHVSTKPAAVRSNVQAPVGTQTEFLTRSALLTLNDANRTGNYTGLRDVAAPFFRERNSAADLALIFAELRRARLDLGVPRSWHRSWRRSLSSMHSGDCC